MRTIGILREVRLLTSASALWHGRDSHSFFEPCRRGLPYLNYRQGECLRDYIVVIDNPKGASRTNFVPLTRNIRL